MDHDLRVEGWGFRLRPVTVDDAAFTIELRADGPRTRYMHAVAPDVERQRAWIRATMERPGDRMFIVERTMGGTRHGMIGLYAEEPDRRRAEWGRWILTEGSLASVASALLIYTVAFDLVGLAEVYSKTVVDNRTVVRFHEQCGIEEVGLIRGGLVRDGESYDFVEHRVTSEDWPAVRARMVPKAEMAARLLDRAAG